MMKKIPDVKRNVTMQEVARFAGVSRATVSRVLSGQGAPITISDSTRQLVLDAVEKLGYRPNRIAQSLMTKNTRIIGVSMAAFATPPDEIDEWHDLYTATLGKIISGIQSVTVRRSYDLQLLGRSETDAKDAPICANSPLDFVEGVIYTSPNPAYDLYTPILEEGIPLVMIGPNPSTHSVSTVSGDNQGAIYALTAALLKRGHRRIALVLPRGLANLLSQLREKGYRLAHEAYGVPVDSKLILPQNEARFNNASCYEIISEEVRELLLTSPRPTAFIVAWADMVMRILQNIQSLELRCPEDVELVSYGDEQGFNTAEPSITALNIRQALMGAKAAELLFEEIEGMAEPGREIICSPRLRVRGSCPLGDDFEPLAAWENFELQSSSTEGGESNKIYIPKYITH